MNKFCIIMAAIMMLGGCKSKKTASDGANASGQTDTPIVAEVPGMRLGEGPIGRRQAANMPGAIVYKTKKDYSNNVAVEMDGRRKALKSYPDPTDICDSARPIALADGFMLDRRGISAGVAFTSFTYQEYAALSAVPSTAELLAKVIDKSPLVAMYKLPINADEAAADTARVNDYIRNGFKDCIAIKPNVGTIKLKQE